MSERHLTDTEALDAIQKVLDIPEWDVGTIEIVAGLIEDSGRAIRDAHEHQRDWLRVRRMAWIISAHTLHPYLDASPEVRELGDLLDGFMPEWDETWSHLRETRSDPDPNDAAPPRIQRWLFVQRFDAGDALTTHETPEEASRAWENDEHDDWQPILLADLDTGERFDPWVERKVEWLPVGEPGLLP